MIDIYYRNGCTSSKKVLEYFERYGIAYHKHQVKQMTREKIYRVLYLTDNGFDDLIKHNGNEQNEYHKEALNNMTVSSAIRYLQLHTEMIKTPIVISESQLLVGYNEEEIRQFIPRVKRSFIE
ncbi:ArsC/Spx/MgsR family protein [Lactococcus petauri]|uniref:ArsC/Spx/MgsR family protein n=1 Tax=Lactococcus petauri TaxID=1940789 RepID=UPI003853AF65